MNRCLVLFAVRSIANSTGARANSTSSQFVPKYNPLNDDDLEKIREFVARTRNLFVLTGAGISTESGLYIVTFIKTSLTYYLFPGY